MYIILETLKGVENLFVSKLISHLYFKSIQLYNFTLPSESNISSGFSGFEYLLIKSYNINSESAKSLLKCSLAYR